MELAKAPCKVCKKEFPLALLHTRSHNCTDCGRIKRADYVKKRLGILYTSKPKKYKTWSLRSYS